MIDLFLVAARCIPDESWSDAPSPISLILANAPTMDSKESRPSSAYVRIGSDQCSFCEIYAAAVAPFALKILKSSCTSSTLAPIPSLDLFHRNLRGQFRHADVEMDLLADMRHRNLEDDRPLDRGERIREAALKCAISVLKSLPSPPVFDWSVGAAFGTLYQKKHVCRELKIRRRAMKTNDEKHRNHDDGPNHDPEAKYKMSACYFATSSGRASVVPDIISPRVRRGMRPARSTATSWIRFESRADTFLECEIEQIFYLELDLGERRSARIRAKGSFAWPDVTGKGNTVPVLELCRVAEMRGSLL